MATVVREAMAAMAETEAMEATAATEAMELVTPASLPAASHQSTTHPAGSQQAGSPLPPRLPPLLRHTLQPRPRSSGKSTI